MSKVDRFDSFWFGALLGPNTRNATVKEEMIEI